MEGEKKTRYTNCNLNDSFFQCARIFIPYLNPTELASISSTCKSLHQISKTITSQRTSDASRGFENTPIPFLNTIKCDPHLYSYFLYTNTQTLQSKPDIRQPWGTANDSRLGNKSSPPDPFLFRVEGASGCNCEICGDGGESYCPCLNGLLMTRECGPSCTCELGCGNRVTQEGVSVKLKVVKDARRGWSLYASELIRNGGFVCEYAGELLSTKEAKQRQIIYDRLTSNSSLTPALLVIKEHIGDSCMRINIDATRIGNIARFINHSCDGGNLDSVILRSSGALLPRICFFASRDIQENEELTFSYGEVSINPNGRPCFCGSSSCTGLLPSEIT